MTPSDASRPHEARPSGPDSPSPDEGAKRPRFTFPTTNPAAAPAKVSQLSALQEAAYKLSRWGLILLASMMAALLSFAAFQEYRHHSLVQQLHASVALTPTLVEPAAFRRAIGVIEAAQQSAQLSPAERSEVLGLVRMLALHPGIDAARRLVFTECEAVLDLPNSERRTASLAQCLNALRSEGALASRPDSRQTLELLKTAQEAHASFRAFWTGAVQILIVNVLFPLVTGLFGFLFGQQSARQGASEE